MSEVSGSPKVSRAPPGPPNKNHPFIATEGIFYLAFATIVPYMNYARPTFRRRIKALLIDYLVILGWMAMLAVASLCLYLLMGGYPGLLGILGPVGAQTLSFLLLTLPVGIYLYHTESGSEHATIGKAKTNLKVLTASHKSPTKKQILLRTVIKLLPWEMAHGFIWQMQYVFYVSGYHATPPMWVLAGLSVASGLALIYILMVALRHDGRGPHDIIAKTQVIQA